LFPIPLHKAAGKVAGLFKKEFPEQKQVDCEHLPPEVKERVIIGKIDIKCCAILFTFHGNVKEIRHHPPIYTIL
jgi:hypothetical protein